MRGDARAAVGASAAADLGSLASAVRANLEASGTAWGRAIEVETLPGQVVRLRGEVESEAGKLMAGRIATDTPAAERVENDLVVQLRIPVAPASWFARVCV